MSRPRARSARATRRCRPAPAPTSSCRWSSCAPAERCGQSFAASWRTALGLVLFIRTTRRVELTPAGSALLDRARTALAEVDLAVDDARRAAQVERAALAIGFGPFSRWLV